MTGRDELESAKDGVHYVLKLYVTGMGLRSQRAIERTRAICDANLAGRYDLEIIDLYVLPEAARPAQIIAAPTLIKQAPPPLRRLVGDLSDRARVLEQLGITEGSG